MLAQMRGCEPSNGAAASGAGSSNATAARPSFGKFFIAGALLVYGVSAALEAGRHGAVVSIELGGIRRCLGLLLLLEARILVRTANPADHGAGARTYGGTSAGVAGDGATHRTDRR